MHDKRDISFGAGEVAGVLDTLGDRDLDGVEFGVVRMDRGGDVVSYNMAESRLSGLDKEAVIGQNFFVQVAPCTNNFLVSQRYQDSDELDETLEYVFTYRMVPTPVRLRLLKRRESHYQYLLVETHVHND
ncbi:MAG: photoactive yellow protein [Spirochaetota bacterium]